MKEKPCHKTPFPTPVDCAICRREAGHHFVCDLVPDEDCIEPTAYDIEGSIDTNEDCF